MSVATPPKKSFRLTRLVLSWYGIAAAFGALVILFLVLKSFGAVNPVLLKISDNVQLRWFGVVITAAIVVGLVVAQFLAERRGDDPEHVWRLLPIVLITGLITARLWFVAFTWDSYKAAPFAFGQPNRIGVLEIWRGGLALQGAVLGGVLGLLAYTRWQRLSFWRLADYVAVGWLVGTAIGRWGNFFNNEAYGRETKIGVLGIKIACDSRTSGAIPGTVDLRCPGFASTGGLGPDALFHPTFFYESVWCYACFLLALWVIMKPKTCERRFKVRPRDGDVFLLGLLSYSIGRLAIESLRADSLFLNGQPDGLRVAQLVSVLVIIGAGAALFARHQKPTPDDQSLSVRVIGPKATRPTEPPKPVAGVELDKDEEAVSKRLD